MVLTMYAPESGSTVVLKKFMHNYFLFTLRGPLEPIEMLLPNFFSYISRDRYFLFS